ncbi:uncharacterized protein TEOVI_000093400 [Trypanosoma equiperdum]|uniref:Uncharacterized protein n=2 Tax=Trypanozoon TaxID=39700 RepID=Q57UY2_TRYB2|nr:hypothetical protein, conserved [Trypanosoma brucei brucei TREU927]AAX70586.1 hypothetical protein, conserved [Trypanosoma brucei]AAZ13234.1 hypothetical protein, conserved [Trypanosoma brucei brucei TREU927]SCU69368.1 hypothetical protein, conserved [Trypanosoma equiperdum]
MLDKIKTIVTRHASQSVSKALTTANNRPSLKDAVSQAAQMTAKLLGEREWQCPCGHKFRASGEWVATLPVYCEVPSCPNPKYYVDGPGRALLEANPSGVRLGEVKAEGKPTIASLPGGVSSRFK